jgi:hypothetical protein
MTVEYADPCLLKGTNAETEIRNWRQIAHFLFQAGQEVPLQLSIDEVTFSAETELVRLAELAEFIPTRHQAFDPIGLLVHFGSQHLGVPVPERGTLTAFDWLNSQFEQKCVLAALPLYEIARRAFPEHRVYILHCAGIHTAVAVLGEKEEFIERIVCPSSYWRGVIDRHGNSLPILNRFRINNAVLHGGLIEYLTNAGTFDLVPAIEALREIGFDLTKGTTDLAEVRGVIDEVCKARGEVIYLA